MVIHTNCRSFGGMGHAYQDHYNQPSGFFYSSVAVSRPSPPSSTGGQLINLIPFIICTAVCFGNFTRGREQSGTERGIKRDEGWYNDVTTGKGSLATV